MAKKTNILEKIVARLDTFQQKHTAFSFPFAVVKKYGDDEAGYLGALLTYYGFLSLFPLLIVATSVIDLVSRNNPELRAKLLTSVTDYIPAIGTQLQASIHGTSQTGIALVIGLLVTLFGTRGIANALQHALNHTWEVPRTKRAGFPKNALKSLSLIVGCGLGFLTAAVLSAYATTTFGHSLALRVFPLVFSFFMLLAVFIFIFRVGSSGKHSVREILRGATLAALGLQILQILGTYVVSHQLKNLQGLYGQFGLVLALLFWLYLQAQVFLYAAEVNTVRSLRLWPRSLTNNPLTSADRKAFALYAKREARQDPPEAIHVDFSSK